MMNIPVFESCRKELEKVYENPFFDPESGMEHKKILELFACHCRENPHENYILTHAYLFRLLCENARLCKEKGHLFAGIMEENKIFNTLFLQRGHFYWQKEFETGEKRTSKLDFEKGYGYMVDVSHVAPDWKRVLALGLPGLFREMEKAPENDFKKAVLMVLEGAMILARRIAAHSEIPEMKSIAERKPQTLYEAFLLTYFLHELLDLTLLF